MESTLCLLFLKGNLFELPFEDYIAVRSKFAFDRLRRDNLITVDYAGFSMLQAMWAREYWFNKNGESDV